MPLFELIHRTRDFIGKLFSSVYIGRDPGGVPPGSIVLFPLHADTLFCGLAGIITLKKAATEPVRAKNAKEAASLFSRIRKSGLKEIFSGSVAAREYLQGPEALGRLEGYVSLWRLDDHFRDIYFDAGKAAILGKLSDDLKAFILDQDKILGENAARLSTDELEIVNSRIIILKDLQWGLEHDILENIAKISDLAGAQGGGPAISPQALSKYGRLNFLLNTIDRLEVRGRDSAGVQVSFKTIRKDLAGVIEELQKQGKYEEFLGRAADGDLKNGSIQLCRQTEGISVSFIYKTASIIGELGRNVRELRAAVRADGIFRLFADLEIEFGVSFAHTRWASVGSITEENCHPVNNFTLPQPAAAVPPGGYCAVPSSIKFEDEAGATFYPAYGAGNWCISVVLNGDIDNYPVLRSELEKKSGIRIAPELTTDTKIIPLQIDKYLREGKLFEEAFRLSLNDFEGSHAIAVLSNLEPGKVFLGLRGSGQSIYVGICPDRYIFSSEVYGLVEATSSFIKMDGEIESVPGDPHSSGQMFILDQTATGGLTGIKARFYNGKPVELAEKDIKHAEITTRDIDRGSFPHFFLKEITESAHSVRKTLLGKYRLTRRKSLWELSFNLGEDILPGKVKERLLSGAISNIVVIGHGTASVAGSAIADGIARFLQDGGKVKVESKKASELSGFFMDNDLSGTLIIPVTQSGTTTDTNRAVAMAVERGAAAIAIVNRRQSDITHKTDGVFYTSDGRDIEMSVASTKAFYSQIVAGHILGLGIARLLGTLSDDAIADELLRLEQIPEMMGRVLLKQDEIRRSVQMTAKQKKYWAVVGSGPNKAAADEIRIKLSELCYKTISSDVIEDKKHIDLSSEPLILVCAAGNPESVLGDIVKDVAIFKAHKAAVVVFTDEGEERFHAVADAVINLPRTDPPLSVILNTMAGHLWGYYAARSIDEDAVFFQEFRGRLNMEMARHEKDHLSLFERLIDRGVYRVIDDFSGRFNEKRSGGTFTLTNVKTISDIALLMKYAAAKLPVEDFWTEFKTDLSPLDYLNISVGHAIDELSRPIDAIRHQAKTVTVGTSRKEEFLRGIIFDLLGSLDFSARNLTGKNILFLSRIQKALANVRGYTLYGVNGLDAEGKPTENSTIVVKQRAGVSLGMKSRAEKQGALLGTKNMIVRTGHVYIGAGKTDRAPIVIIPMMRDGKIIRELLLVHVEYNDALSVEDKKDVLGYTYYDIRNLLTEYNLPWNDQYLEGIPTGFLLAESIETIVAEIRKGLNGVNPGNPLKIKPAK
jgi:glucosamine--fructose-6-phosphate aminotransferase (isomerizing)